MRRGYTFGFTIAFLGASVLVAGCAREPKRPMRYEPRVGVLRGPEDLEAAHAAVRQCIARVIPVDPKAELRVTFRIVIKENGEKIEAEPQNVTRMKPGSKQRLLLETALAAIHDPTCRAPARQDYRQEGYQFLFDLLAGPHGWGF